MPASIRWTNSQKQKLSQAVRSYNAKITRESKKNPGFQLYAPKKVTVKQLKENIQTANDLNREIKSLNRIFLSGALEPKVYKSGLVLTKYEAKETQYKINRINRARAKELQKLPDHPEYHGTLGTIQENALKPKKFNPDKIKPSSWENYAKTIETQVAPLYFEEKYSAYKNNYIKAVKNNLGIYQQPILEILDFFTPEEINNSYYINDRLNIKYIYPLLKNDDEEIYHIAEDIIDAWKDMLKNKYRKANKMDRVIMKAKLLQYEWASDIDFKKLNKTKPKS